MKTAVVTVGKELLTGRTVNTNLRSIALKLKSIGIDVNRSYVIDDLKKEFVKILDFMDEDLIIFTGGLGPTVDDITRETVIGYFGVDTYMDQVVLDKIKYYFDRAEVEVEETAAEVAAEEVVAEEAPAAEVVAEEVVVEETPAAEVAAEEVVAEAEEAPAAEENNEEAQA